MSESESSLLLSDSEIVQLSQVEAEDYLAVLQELERQNDLDDLAAGLTADLSTFIRQAWEIIEPDTTLLWSWHYDYLAEWLTLISSGEFRERFPDKLGLIINVPPRSAKSNIASIIWPVWSWLKYPSKRFLFASHSLKLSSDHNSKRSFLIASKWFQERFSDHFSLTADGSTLLRNDHTGQFFVTSVASRQTGFGGQICVGDDLLDRADQRSVAVKSETINWLDSSFSKMLNNAVSDVFVHISQRLALDDPTGHLLGEDGSTGRKEDWVHIKIKREAEEDEKYIFPISGQVHFRPKGDILQPDRCTPSVLRGLKSKSREWAGQEQQEPTPATGAILNPNWLKYYRSKDPLPTFYRVVLSVDAAFKAAADSDLVAIQKWGLVGNRRYLLDRRTEHLGYVASKQAIKEMARGGQDTSWLSQPMPAAIQLLLENKANGPAIAEEMRADSNFGLAVIEYNPQGSKDQRFYAATGDVEAGLVYLPADAPWVGPFTKTLTDFAGEGSVPHDDDPDAFSQLVNWSRTIVYVLTKWAIYKDAWVDELLYDDGPTTQALRVHGGNQGRYIGVSYGTVRPQVYLEVIDDGETLWVDREYSWDSNATGQQKTDAQYANELEEFLKESPDAQVIMPMECASFADELSQRGIWFMDADGEDKEGIRDGIRAVSTMMTRRKLRVHRKCINLVREISTYIWDPDKAAIGIEEPSEENDSHVNALRRVVKNKIYPWRLSMPGVETVVS